MDVFGLRDVTTRQTLERERTTLRDKMTRESLLMESARAEVASDRDALNLRLSESERSARRLESERETWQAERKQLCDDASERERTLAEVIHHLLRTGAATL